MGAMVLIGFLMMTQVVPTLKKTFDEVGVDLPATTRAIIKLSDFLVGNTIVSLLAIIGFVVTFMYALRTPQGKRLLDGFVLRIPAIGTIAKEVNAARFARTLGSLLSSGVDIVTALDITSNVVQNTYHREVIVAAAKVVQSGEPMSVIFGRREDLYPPMVSEMLAVGEETGKLSEMLGEVAKFYEAEVDQKTKDMSTIIEPFLMLFIGGGVGFFAMAMISPIYSLSDSI
jgi:type IV pilus assembly protein PilC